MFVRKINKTDDFSVIGNIYSESWKCAYKNINALKSDGFRDIYLWVLVENSRARKFYEKNGFVNSCDNMIVEIGGKKLNEIKYIYRHE